MNVILLAWLGPFAKSPCGRRPDAVGSEVPLLQVPAPDGLILQTQRSASPRLRLVHGFVTTLAKVLSALRVANQQRLALQAQHHPFSRERIARQ